MLAMATLNLAGYTKLGEEAWIDKRDGPGGPMGWLTTECVGQSCVMGYYGYIVANFMADGLLVSVETPYLYGMFTDVNHRFGGLASSGIAT